MKRVRILFTVPGEFEGRGYLHVAGSTPELPDKLADDLIRGGHAELIAEKQPEKAQNTASKSWQKAEKR